MINSIKITDLSDAEGYSFNKNINRIHLKAIE